MQIDMELMIAVTRTADESLFPTVMTLNNRELQN